MNYKARVNFLSMLIGSVLVAAPPHTDIQREVLELYRVRRVWPNTRRRLLQILHGTRALDTTLRTVLVYHGCLGTAKSLGQYLVKLETHSATTIAQLSSPERKRFQSSIVKRRNRYMHESGAFPANDTEIDTLLSEMQACLHTVLLL